MPRLRRERNHLLPPHPRRPFPSVLCHPHGCTHCCPCQGSDSGQRRLCALPRRTKTSCPPVAPVNDKQKRKPTLVGKALNVATTKKENKSPHATPVVPTPSPPSPATPHLLLPTTATSATDEDPRCPSQCPKAKNLAFLFFSIS